MSLTVQFFGTRGSLPGSFNQPDLHRRLTRVLCAAQGRRFESEAAASAFLEKELPFADTGTYGTNTACVAVSAPGVAAPLLFDAGTGLRDAGNQPRQFSEQHLFLSHLHWDHIQGLPFYRPLHDSDFHLIIHTCHPKAEAALVRQMEPPFFPVPLSGLSAKITIKVHQDQDIFEAGGFLIQASRQCHPGDSYGFRVSRDDRVVVYSTDAARPEFGKCANCKCPQLFDGADLLIYDAMLTEDEERFSKSAWGHSSNISALRFGALAKAKQLALIHHAPLSSDARLNTVYEETRALAKKWRREKQWSPDILQKIWMAYDGLTLKV